MKTLLSLAIWISGIVAVVVMILGLLSLLLKTAILGVNHGVNFFHMANSFLLLAICALIYKRVSEEK